jgi:hypothetical protein
MRTNVVCAALTALGLRAFFLLRFPSTGAEDSPFYIELAWNWLKNGVYGFPIYGRLTPVDVRVPGFPAFLAAVFIFAGKSSRAVMWCQAVVDVATCFLIALIALRIAPEASRRRVEIAALWLAALCPFTANYTAVLLTETLVTFLTALAILVLLETDLGAGRKIARTPDRARPLSPWFLAGIIVGFGTLVRPETPLLLIAAGVVIVAKWWRPADWRRMARAAALLALGLVLPLLPWAARNLRTLHEVQFLAPRYSLLPGEFATRGFDAWTATWLWRFRDVYLVPWKLDAAVIQLSDVPPSAFDSTEERDRVADLLDEYNDTLTISRAEDRVFGQIARERTGRHRLRTYLKIPLLRSVAMWFTPRIELLPVAGDLWPVGNAWQYDRSDFLATLILELIDIGYVALALTGVWCVRRQPGVALLVVFILLRTAFFAKFAETPEPRYMLECFPAVIALGAQALGGRRQLSSTGSG